ncbi:tRNA (adenosine(37)-N6)-threonylcarbamoyltransferase complex ATPase subunit type 1 TsaE [Nocardioides sp. cx-169]|uniref:tRNA (adenosine(37)-N6)-threonylcarbamoyltransferase complex ATPase subunit type 1 TsaE n=1 Tax=Nocardioides sp. cx-169 TaxID=2899080 RepID=UPI001E30C68B|nr:tRNA (adenosine(37)-N6)-threonylcarbamoyltransferase complex ATPase subunit type 1 TsaE [Nocardioides sp. cx-169]MCD4535704.1 tRNA (adenosine(37)-N6)-threonylcarbamoyltransferase complex ATPase subunit type 1 TsaE [Nocardioides sp. cx-169]
MTLTVRRVGHESAEVVHHIVHEAFAGRPPLDPPADALSETVDSIGTRLALNGGLVARVGDEPVGALLFDPVGDSVYLRRFGVLPAAQGHGVAAAMVDAAVEAWPGKARLSVVAREELPATVAFWQRRGFAQADRRWPYVELSRPLPRTFDAPTSEDMRALGARIAGELRPGDLLVLSGGLGAGKTTFTQGLGEGLKVRGAVTSPTFVIARVHPSLRGGPDLVHVDAYRLGGLEELDDLDLDTSLDEAVTVVEWGEGMAEGLSDSRLEVRITRAAEAERELDPRRVEVLGVGTRWAN